MLVLCVLLLAACMAAPFICWYIEHKTAPEGTRGVGQYSGFTWLVLLVLLAVYETVLGTMFLSAIDAVRKGY